MYIIFSHLKTFLIHLVPCCFGRQWRWWTGSQGTQTSVAPHPTSAHPWLQSHELWAGSGAVSAGLSTDKWIKNASQWQTHFSNSAACTSRWDIRVRACPACCWWAWRSERRWFGSASEHRWQVSLGGWKHGPGVWPPPRQQPASRRLGNDSGSCLRGWCPGAGCSGAMGSDQTDLTSAQGTCV